MQFNKLRKESIYNLWLSLILKGYEILCVVLEEKPKRHTWTTRDLDKELVVRYIKRFQQLVSKLGLIR